MTGSPDPDIVAALEQMPLFSELTAEDLDYIASHTRKRHLDKSEVLFQRGDPPRGFYFVVSGQIKLALSSSQGNEKVVEIISPRQSFGEAVMFMNRPYPVFAEALLDTQLLHVSHTAIAGLLEHDIGFAQRLLAAMSIRLHTLIRDVETYSLRSSAQRVIGYLLQLADGDGPCDVSLPTSKQVIASRLNLTPETLSRILHDLTEAGLITVSGRHIILHDPKRLARHTG